jgi:hypothetical protein
MGDEMMINKLNEMDQYEFNEFVGHVIMPALLVIVLITAIMLGLD